MSLLPADYIKNSMDAYIDKHTTRSQKIYWVVLAFIIVAVASLPFIYVDVSVQDQGVVRPLAEKTELKAAISEFVDSVYVKEGAQLLKGDTLLTFRQTNANYKIQYQQNRLQDFRSHLRDLEKLSKGEKPTLFHSNTRQQEYIYFCQQKREYENRLTKAENDFERNESLFQKKVISLEEFEKYQYEYQQATNELATLIDNQQSKWQTERNSYSNSYQEMLSLMQQEMVDKDLYVVTSPVNGTLDQFRSIYKGTTIQAGSSIAVISPDSTLYFDVYVSPRNIGYIHIGMPVNIQVETFNYNEWGTIGGKVLEISSDFFTDSSTGGSYYKVKCNMEKDYLSRKNGATGKLKKGMNVVCHFVLTQRSLFDLLYQKMDDWVNPTQHTNNLMAEKK